MKKIIINIVLLIATVFMGHAQAPDWTVEENNYEYSMSLVAFVNIDGTNLNSTNDLVGAFVNNELRGVTNLVYVPSNGRYYAYLTVFANSNSEMINFKIYNSNTDQIVDMPQEFEFVINSHYGDIFQAFSLANPILNSNAEIINFDFENANVSSIVINDNQINLYVDSPVDITQLNATFELSQGARMYDGSALIESSNNNLDYSTPKQLLVLSEDESLLKEWTIIVNYSSAVGDLSYYKKDAVCYRGGEIKVTSTEDGTTAVLYSGSVIVDSQIFNSGQVLFTGLNQGVYLVFVDGVEKVIEINLDE